MAESLDEAQKKLLAMCRDAGGVAAFCRQHGLTRNNVENMAKGAIPVSPRVAEIIGLRRVDLQFFIDATTELPPELQRFLVQRKPIPGRPKMGK